MSFPAVSEFDLGAFSAEGASDEQHAMPSMRDRGGRGLVDQHTVAEALE